MAIWWSLEMSNYPQNFLSAVLASQGDFTIPPVTAEDAGSGKFSQQEGFPASTSQSPTQGGFPPDRLDFNGAFNLLSQFIVWYQQGGLLNYSSQFDYEVGNEILFNGVKYRCLQANGPASSAVTPGSNPSVWKNMDSNVPVGAVVPFYNVTLGGSDGRRPIFWGQTDADEGWVLCDGGSDGQSGTVPNLIGNFIKGSNVASAGQTGGSATQTLTSDQLPEHTHTVTIQSAGSHTHTRGTMEITGTGLWWESTPGSNNIGGCFYFDTEAGRFVGSGDSDNDNITVSMQASRSWTGATSSSGSHTHSATCSTTGSSSASINTQPPFYQLAYFVKLPEA